MNVMRGPRRYAELSLARRLEAIALATLAITCAIPASAQPVITQHTSPAGLAFRHVHMPEDTHQALNFFWRDGSAVAFGDKEALSTLGVALMLEGPKGSTRGAMHEELRDLQASLGLNATVSFTEGRLSAPRARFSEAARILARVLGDPALPEDRLADMRRNRAAATRQAAENGETLAQRLLTRRVLGASSYQRFLTADQASLESITLADIEAWRRNILVRDGLVVVTAGPLDPTEAGREIDSVFAGLPQAGKVPARPKPVLHAPGKLVVIEKPVVQTGIAAGGPTTLAVTPDLVRAELATRVLGGGFPGRLFRAVRERLGAAYGITATLQAVDAESRSLVIHSAVANDKARDALAAIRTEYARFVAEGVADDELEPLKTRFVTENHERLRRAPSLSSTVLGLTLRGYPDDYLATFEARVRGYDRAGVNAELAATFPKPLTIVMVAPSADGLGADCVIKAPEEIARCE